MGQVYRAEDKLLGGVAVAVKFLSQALLNNRMKERFEREATISALLGEKSSHIVKVRDYGVDEKEIPFYVMEYLQGDSLSEIIKFRPLPINRFLNMTRQICFGMECAHKGITFQGEICPIVHRDIKPSNMLVVQDAALGELVKILDFGIAKLVQSRESQTQSFMGTLAYCSPEQMEGKELDSRSDIYSLGIMMYEMLSGEMPIFPDNSSFGGWYEAHHYAKPHALNSSLRIPPDLEHLIASCLAKSPNDRPQSVSEILKLLEAIETNLRVETRQPHQASATTVIAPPATPKPSLAGAKEICLKMAWPKDKPIHKIVFPNVMQGSEGNFVSLWVMLEQDDILNRLNSTRYNQFLFMTTPHPMILWITVLYHPQLGPRWLPCYLDLKTPAGQRSARLLGETGAYWIIFFALESPGKSQHPLSLSIAPSQCQLLKEWADSSQVLKGDKPQITKRMLRKEFDRLKPSILSKLEGAKTQLTGNLLKV
jgi:serine/threonine protein kinase